ncbi:MAG: hypothetical protein AB8B50_18320 [Pirellulaceae bacterium]
MFDFIGRYFSRWGTNCGEGIQWMLNEMSVNQWAILAGVFVFAGFMALKTKI